MTTETAKRGRKPGTSSLTYDFRFSPGEASIYLSGELLRKYYQNSPLFNREKMNVIIKKVAWNIIKFKIIPNSEKSKDVFHIRAIYGQCMVNIFKSQCVTFFKENYNFEQLGRSKFTKELIGKDGKQLKLDYKLTDITQDAEGFIQVKMRLLGQKLADAAVRLWSPKSSFFIHKNVFQKLGIKDKFYNAVPRFDQKTMEFKIKFHNPREPFLPFEMKTSQLKNKTTSNILKAFNSKFFQSVFDQIRKDRSSLTSDLILKNGIHIEGNYKIDECYETSPNEIAFKAIEKGKRLKGNGKHDRNCNAWYDPIYPCICALLNNRAPFGDRPLKEKEKNLKVWRKNV